MSKKSEASLSLTDCLCQICMEIFVEPVTLPCNHTLCNSCFQLTVEKASLCCPFCRRRVSSWARYNARRNTLINWELWEKIQKNYPEECKHRVNGQDLVEELCISQPLHQLSKPGELRKEYEAEISKVEAERRAHEQEENKASEEYIQKLLAEEEAEHRLAEERRKEMEEQLKRDEQLAWELNNSLNKHIEEPTIRTSSLANSLSSGPSPVNSCKTKNKSCNSGDIQKYLSPKPCSALVSTSLSTAKERERNGSFSMESSSTEDKRFILQEDEREEMPSLSPQTFLTNLQNTEVKDSFLESCLTYLSVHTPVRSYPVKREGMADPQYQVDEIANAEWEEPETGLPNSTRDVARSASENDDFTCKESINLGKTAENSTSVQEAADSVFASPSAIQILMKVSGNNSGEGKISNGLQNTNETPKRKYLDSPIEAAIDSCLLDKRRKTFPETFEDQKELVNDLHLQIHMDLEQKLLERHKQEEQDRLLALELQRQIDKEERTLNRQKGSPDEYLLRTKLPPSKKESPTGRGSCKMRKDSKSLKNQTEMACRTLRRASHNENWQSPTKLQLKSPSVRGGKVLNCVVNSCDSQDIQSRPKTKQNTILQMFKRSVSE
ncbi:PREDICTED: E3 ubiquitin-protein ligase RNF168 [Gavialis gangeticus]|uniref:E3 ubiquitin-protein ligase RNF168 n=1 Tax=Gavialis gangeticus TaxID=94835 RepID=UPI00092FAD2B|nr:PREDICTED: E3 ubiquitin-protein ligase RNF168 [Gavialis gangeticus]